MTQQSDALVVFTPSGRRGRFPLGTSLLHAARSLGVDLDSVCGGRGLCGRCQVVLSEGKFAKHGIISSVDHLSSFAQTEARQTKRARLREGRRLGCAALILGDVVVDVPADSQVHRQVVRKRAEVHDIEVDPVVRLYYVAVKEPDMHDPSGDLRRLENALELEWQRDGLRCDLRVIQSLQVALRKGEWKVTVAVHNDNEIIAVWPGFRDKAFGLAIDVGSTTIAAHLCDLASGEVMASAGLMNPQIRFGEDLMSRVSYIQMNPGSEQELTRVVRGAVNDLILEVCREAAIEPEEILDLTFVGNPIMHHLLLGINPVELGLAPFALATDTAVKVWASELQMKVHPNARTYVLPCVAGHVGADAAGVVLSEGPYLGDPVTLLVDVGTNAEIVLGNRRRMLAASSPTGPAFEGAQISCGQRAAPGAIERVRIDPVSLEPRFRVIGNEHWSDSAQFAEAGAGIGVTGICGSGIIEVIAEMYLAGILSRDGIIKGAQAQKSPRIIADGRTWSYRLHSGEQDLLITQNDVRAIQLAKAALYAGIRLLMDHMDIEKVDRIRLAGAFGSHIDVKYAMILGMIPDCLLDQVTSAGNAAGTGARIALLDRKARQEIEDVVRRIDKIETAVEANFQVHFIAAMAIPHKTDAFEELSKVVKFPDPESDQPVTARSRRRSKLRSDGR